MRYVVQRDKNVLNEEADDLIWLLTNTTLKYVHNFCEISRNDIKDFKWNFDEDIPVGTLEFIGDYLEMRGLSRWMKPIEVPEFLREEKFLHRSYEVLDYKDLPKIGRYFVKDVSVLKAWQPQEFFMSMFDDMIGDVVDGWKEHKYSVQSKVDLVAEYRIFICKDSVEAVQYYDGTDKLSFPDKNTVLSMINQITYHRDVLKELLPQSYTLDIGVDSKGNTLLIEMHNFVSCGTYGFKDEVLATMYRDGIEFEISNQVS